MYSGEQGGREGRGPSDAPKLYSLELDVRSYERLRRQESLLVDFTEFLNNMVWLLEQACGGGGEVVGRQSRVSSNAPEAGERRTFRAVLCDRGDAQLGSGSTTLQIKEHTAFRELAHLTLPVEENTDRGMVKFLSGRLHELVCENQRYQTKIAALEQDGRVLEQQLAAMQQQMSADTSLHSNEASSWKMQCDMLRSQVASMKEQHAFLKEQTRVAEAGASRDKSQLVEAEATCASLRAEVAELLERVESSERANSTLEEDKVHNEREVARLRDLCEGYKSASGMADARVEDWKRMAKSHEEQASTLSQEVQTLERKLSKATHELEQARKHVRDLEHRAAQRDSLMQTQEEALQSAQSRVSDLQQQQRLLEAQLDDARKQIDDSKVQAAEAAKKCENSEKMIVWLNKQLTSIQLGGSGGSIPAIKNGTRHETGSGCANGKGNTAPAPAPLSTKAGDVHGVIKTSTPSPLQPRSRLARSGA